MEASNNRTDEVLSFGPFNLLVNERLLIKQGIPVELGGRALDLLIALTSTPNEVVSKKTLMSRVWPDVIVEEGSLRFHINGLRKALGDGWGDARYITTLPGRGYCFVAPVSRMGDPRQGASVTANFAHANLPHRLVRMVGREETIADLSAQLTTSRIVSIVGSGGIGKTTVAIAVGHQLREIFNGAVLFVDFGMVSDPNLMVAGLASMLGLSVGSVDVRPSMMAYLRDRRILLILDTCEHLIEAVAMLAKNIAEAAPQVHILTTSREALCVEGEQVYKLDALACPPDGAEVTARSILSFPATQLFAERAAASGATLIMSDADAHIIGNICRRLDGVPLALEFAARRVQTYGLQQTYALLDQHMALGWSGSRTAPSRQKTLQATLDWSFGLLTEPERSILRRLSIFAGYFTLDAALEIIATPALDRSAVFQAIDSLVAKSMLDTQPIGAALHYRLLDTTREYAIQLSGQQTERGEVAGRHAAYFRRWLDQFGANWHTLSTGADRAPHFAALANVRVALDWCFSASGDLRSGVELAAAAVRVFLAMGLLSECRSWSERAISALDDTTRDGPSEMHLQAGIGVSGMYMRGGRDTAYIALCRGLKIAEEKGDVFDQLRILGPLWGFHHNAGEFRTALHYAERYCAITTIAGDSATLALGQFLLGNSLHLSGELCNASLALEEASASGPWSQRTTASYLHFGGKHLVGATLSRVLWLQGHPVQAATRAVQTIHDVAETGHALSLCITLGGVIPVFLWNGDLPSAEKRIEWLMSHAEAHSLSPHVFLAQGFHGELAIRRGDAIRGVEILRQCLEKLSAATFEVHRTVLEIPFVQGLVATGRLEEGAVQINKTIERVQTKGDVCYMPELLRIKASILLATPEKRLDEAEACFVRSLELSRRQGARAWELKTAVDLAAYLTSHGRTAEGQALLQPIWEQFTEGSETADMKAAQRLLTTLH
jgi:predicted ATPase/DNA-binding winged helix-turn-helix (wHTH) protein